MDRSSLYLEWTLLTRGRGVQEAVEVSSRVDLSFRFEKKGGRIRFGLVHVALQ